MKVKARVFSEDKNRFMDKLVVEQSGGRFYVRFSKYSGLAPHLRSPDRGFTTVWLQGNLRDGLVLPHGSLLP